MGTIVETFEHTQMFDAQDKNRHHIIIIVVVVAYHKKSIRRLDVLATIVLLAFDPSVSPSTLGTKSRRDIVNSPE